MIITNNMIRSGLRTVSMLSYQKTDMWMIHSREKTLKLYFSVCKYICRFMLEFIHNSSGSDFLLRAIVKALSVSWGLRRLALLPSKNFGYSFDEVHFHSIWMHCSTILDDPEVPKYARPIEEFAMRYGLKSQLSSMEDMVWNSPQLLSMDSLSSAPKPVNISGSHASSIFSESSKSSDSSMLTVSFHT